MSQDNLHLVQTTLANEKLQKFIDPVFSGTKKTVML